MYRDFKDQCLLFLMYACSFIACLILSLVIYFVVSNGLKVISFDFIIQNPSHELIRYELNITDDYLNDDYDSKWSLSLEDKTNYHQEEVVVIKAFDNDIWHNYPKLKEGMIVERIVLVSANQEIIAGKVVGDNADSLTNKLNQADMIVEISLKENTYGILGSIKTTIYLMILTLLFALPLGILGAIYLHEYAKDGLIKDLMLNCINLLSGIPSIIFGLVAIKVLFPIMQLFNVHTTSILLGALTLSVMVLPLIITNTLEALGKVDVSLKQASYALGASELQTLVKVIIPEILVGIVNGALLALSRVIADSAALICALGCVYVDKPNILSQGTSLALQIFNIMSYEDANYEVACGIALIILIMMLMLNLSVKMFIKYYENKRS